MEYVAILFLPYVLGIVISVISTTGFGDNWATEMPFSEVVARIITWPIWATIFVCKGFIKAVIREITKF